MTTRSEAAAALLDAIEGMEIPPWDLMVSFTCAIELSISPLDKTTQENLINKLCALLQSSKTAVEDAKAELKNLQ